VANSVRRLGSADRLIARHEATGLARQLAGSNLSLCGESVRKKSSASKSFPAGMEDRQRGG
jgi:hypothetical protein